ncbi:lysylphosphatidylglycerol synthase domain-containing protein [Hyphomicrobium sp.]|jgi:putative membrane protein|uniref:lysylphosphatidylglycerol synthase domain-containing protein n=1 Tax=Hyphomicrobium sp. TaxID=82 RepID=UPI002D7E80D5|nr:lysylphosphatidylglycerol synthase domain-containing protein [Hyphomicrobium sp.]
MKTGVALIALVGVAAGTALVVYIGSAAVGDAFLAAGWRGLAAMTAVYLTSVVLCAFSWRALAVVPQPDGIALFNWVRLLRDSAANILAIVPGAGEAVAARELTVFGMSFGAAIATTVVDVTMEIVSQLFFTLLGLAILVKEQPNTPLAWWALAGLVIGAAAMAAFIVAQRSGLFRFLQSLPDRLGLTAPWNTEDGSHSIHAGIEDIYRAPRRPIACAALHLIAWIVGAGEAWIALSFMGHPLDFGDVLAIESLIFALRTIAFVVPWAAGIQEGGYVAVGALFGLTPDVALGLSLLKRARELLTGVPTLLIWQALEARRLLQTPHDAQSR